MAVKLISNGHIKNNLRKESVSPLLNLLNSLSAYELPCLSVNICAHLCPKDSFKVYAAAADSSALSVTPRSNV